MFSSAALSVTFWEHYVSILQLTTVMILQLLVDSASFHFDPPPDVLSISLLDLQKYKEALVGKWSRVKNPVVDTKFGLSTVRHSILTPPPLTDC